MKRKEDIKKVLIIGSGPIIIGQACEFDYSGTQACKALRNLGYEIVLVNSNPATIMTDPEIADATYIEPLNVERLEQIIAKERPDALLPNLGGQSGLNLCSELAQAGILEKYDVDVIGVQLDAIERGEDRIEFKKTMDSLGIEMARSEVAYTIDEALAIADKLGYPVVLRPAYTMGGTGGGLVYNIDELKSVCARGLQASLVGHKWIGVGGKFETGESPLECVQREVKEETGLTMTNPRFRGIVTFVSDEWGAEYMHLFTCTEFTGTLTDCDEGELVWLPKDELLTKKMWAGDRLFLKALDERSDFFSLKLRYRGEELVESKFE